MVVAVMMTAFSACNVTKFVPQDQQLLYKTKIKVSDAKDVGANELKTYLRQTHNSEILGFWKLQLHIYNTAPSDTTTKSRARLARNAHKMGEAPEIYDDELTGKSMEQLQKAMRNMGYFDARVDTTIRVKNRKVWLTYYVRGNDPYLIRDYKAKFAQADLNRFANSRGCMVKDGMQFNAALLDEERDRVATRMRIDGYYNFDKSLLEYEADSSYKTNEVAVRMKLQDYVDELPDSVREQLYTRYHIHDVHFHLDKNLKLSKRVLRRRCVIRPGDMYNEMRVERSYANLNSLGPVKYVEISFEPLGGDSLDCHVTITKTKMNSISAEVEGTYCAGDWGIAAGLGYVNRNIFHGAEQLNINARTQYEWRQNGGRAIEAKGELGLTFPNSLKINLAYQYQTRPDEYVRNIANGGLYYLYHKPRSRWHHSFNLIDLSYVYLPWMSSEFKAEFVDKSSALRYTYEDHFILDWSYMGSYSSQRPRQPYRSYITFNYTLETAGNLLYGISKVAKMQQDSAGVYTLFNIPYSQYAKADVNFTFHQFLHPQHQLVYHIGVGAAVPYLNAKSVPFEKRYFAGGSNSVRGWQARTLGPGAFKGTGGGLVYDLQAGDIRLDLNLEYRWKVFPYIELAAFLDAGNIWTINDYAMQPHGLFEWDTFYKQLAFSYGVGLRLDFTILVFRVDFGVKLHDPTRTYTDGKVWRTADNGLGWNDDMTFHFAIGYPF